jgi:hypothetical protein
MMEKEAVENAWQITTSDEGSHNPMHQRLEERQPSLLGLRVQTTIH